MTHKKIAELAHVSASTVSKALSGSAEVSPELAENIRKIAIESGYFNEKIKRKREYTENSSLLIAIIVPEISGFFYPSIINCLKEAIESKGGNVAIYLDDFDTEKRNSLIESAIVSGNTDGIIVISTPKFTSVPTIPTICITGSKSDFCDTVGADMEKLMTDSVAYLKELGHTQIGFAGECHTFSKSDAFRKAMISAGLKVDNDFINIINDRFENIGIESAKKILASNKRPTAIIAAYDEIAYGLINELTGNGVNVPDDISIMGINNIASADYVKIPLTTVDVFSEEQYRTAVNHLFDKIFNRTDAIHHITIQHKIVERQTTKRIEKTL